MAPVTLTGLFAQAAPIAPGRIPPGQPRRRVANSTAAVRPHAHGLLSVACLAQFSEGDHYRGAQFRLPRPGGQHRQACARDARPSGGPPDFPAKKSAPGWPAPRTGAGRRRCVPTSSSRARTRIPAETPAARAPTGARANR